MEELSSQLWNAWQARPRAAPSYRPRSPTTQRDRFEGSWSRPRATPRRDTPPACARQLVGELHAPAERKARADYAKAHDRSEASREQAQAIGANLVRIKRWQGSASAGASDKARATESS